MIKKNKKSNLEFEEIIRLILASMVLIALIVIIGGIITGKINNYIDKIFDFLDSLI